MARPREFEEAQVLTAAREAFQSLGYAGAAVSDLCAYTGLSRASLYNAFEDKEGLFLAVLDAYLRAGAAAHTEALARGLPPVHALLSATLSATPRGCVIMQGIAQLDALPPRARAGVLAAATSSRALLEEAVVAGQSQGEIDPTLSVEDATGLLHLFFSGLSTAARMGMPPETLQARVTTLLARLAPPPPSE